MEIFTIACTEYPELSTYWLCARQGPVGRTVAYNELGVKGRSGPTQEELDEFTKKAEKYFKTYREDYESGGAYKKKKKTKK